MNNKLIELKERAEQYKRILSQKMLVATPFIVEVGALTVTTDENDAVKLQNTRYPTEYTQKAVDIIRQKVKFSNASGSVTPIIYGRLDWYKKELEAIEETIKLMGESK